MSLTTAASLRARVASGQLLTVPGAPNALAARIAEDVGFTAVYVTGAGVANTFLGVPDIGLLTLTELTAHVAAMSQAVEVPLIVDGDTGFGNAIGVRRTVAELERAGAAAIQLEDQTFPKRCGHFAGKEVIALDEMVAKVGAAVDARTDPDTMIIARTDARAVEGLEAACRRANAYREAGADMLFVEAPRSEAEIEHVATTVTGPKLINFVVGGATPQLSNTRLQALGFSVALHANLSLLAAVHGMQTELQRLLDGLDPVAITSWDQRQRLVRKPVFDEWSRTYSTTGS